LSRLSGASIEYASALGGFGTESKFVFTAREKEPVPIKDILVALAPRDETDPARDYALAMAVACNAHLTAAAYPVVPEIPGSVFPEFAAGLVQKAQVEAETAVNSARVRLRAGHRLSLVFRASGADR